MLFKVFLPTLSFAQCQSNNRNEGLISATQGILGNTLFGNLAQNGTTGVCITGTADASYREFKVPSYQDLEDQFYTFNRSLAKKTTPLPLTGTSLSFTGGDPRDGLYLRNGDLTISAASGTGAQVIFIKKDATTNGDLNITGNIDYAGTDSTSGLVFIVQGNINIYSTVTKVNAVLISSGIICTAYISGTGCANGTTDITPALEVNGSLISLNKAPSSGYAIKFVRNLQINDQAAEVVNKQPKYLYILRNGLFTRDLVITTEDQHYLITTSNTPQLSVSGSCKPTPFSAFLPNAQANWYFTGTISGNGPYNYAWSESGTQFGSGPSSSINRTYTTPGAKTVSLIITDLGNTSTPPSQPITCSNFIVNNVTVSCSKTNPPNPVYTTDQVTWTAVPVPANPPTGSYTYSWSLGDGLTSTSNPATATYTNSPGSKTATVTLTNNGYTTPASICNPNPMVVANPPPLPAKRVFITSNTYRGLLTNGQPNGIAGANKYCQDLANGKGWGGSTWLAWLTDSSSSNSPSNRFTKTFSYKKVNAGQTKVADTWADLTDGSLDSQINVDENGATVSPGEVWTNTKGDGTILSTTNSCNNWTSNSGTPTAGYGNNNLSGSGEWTNTTATVHHCNDQLRLYCFEQ